MNLKETVPALIAAFEELADSSESKKFILPSGFMCRAENMLFIGSRDFINLVTKVEILIDSVLIAGKDELHEGSVEQLASRGYKITRGDLGCLDWREYFITTPKFKFYFS